MTGRALWCGAVAERIVSPPLTFAGAFSSFRALLEARARLVCRSRSDRPEVPAKDRQTRRIAKHAPGAVFVFLGGLLVGRRPRGTVVTMRTRDASAERHTSPERKTRCLQSTSSSA